MNKKIFVFVVTAIVGHAAFSSISPSEVKEHRGFAAAIEANKKIYNYLQGRAKATPDIFVELLKFAEEMDSRQGGLTSKATELLSWAEEVGKQLRSLDSETREQLKPVLTSLLNQYQSSTKNDILRRIFDRFWFWSPEHLDYFARMVRNDKSAMIATQLIWVMERATPKQRQEFFSQVPNNKPNPMIRWFYLAISHKFGRPIDAGTMKRSLGLVNPDRLRPEPRLVVLNGRTLPTTEDLYNEVKSQLNKDVPGADCPTYVISAL